MSKFFIVAGSLILIIGILLYFIENTSFKWFSWFGNLLGDIKIEKEHFQLYFPFTSTLLLSVVISLVLYIIKKIMG